LLLYLIASTLHIYPVALLHKTAPFAQISGKRCCWMLLRQNFLKLP